ncbi:MAG: DUF1592 domain-containing protein, partial [Myxococcota bacterium]|nr:DUF1592 domain-containing protein [Myxococcota bacterium]
VLNGADPTTENLEMLRNIAQRTLPNVGSYTMEQKVLGFLNHGGGLRFPRFSEEYKIIVEFLQRENEGLNPCEQNTCSEESDRVGHGGLKRLTPIQLQNTVMDSFGIEVGYPELYIQEAQPWHLGNVSYEELRALSTIAEDVGDVIGTEYESMVGCGDDDACAFSWFREKALVAFRRPMSGSERTFFYDLIQSQSQTQNGLRIAVEALLQSPQFLYMGSIDSFSSLPPDYALAEKMSYFLWDAPPSPEMLEMAQQERIQAELDTIIDTMLEDDRCATKFARVNQDWLGAAKILGRYKDASYFPNFDADTAESIRYELQLFSEHVWKESATLNELFSSSQGYVNTHMEDLYGVSASAVTVDDWQPVSLPPTERSGILSRAAIPASHTVALHPSIAHRGHMLARRLLCLPFGIAPNGFEMDSMLPNTFTGESAQTISGVHQSDAVCASCHSLLDPFGIALEHYDAVGGWRATISDSPIDPSGEIESLAVSFSDISSLQASLLETPLLYECYTETWLQHAQMGSLNTDETCTSTEIASTFQQSGDVKQLLRAIIHSTVFQQRGRP